MRDDLLLGADFLNTIDLRCRAGNITISRIKQVSDGNEICRIDVFNEVNRVDVSHIRSETSIKAVETLVENYKPNKTKEVDMKVRIILKYEIPVYQRARRLAPVETKMVYDQIDEWVKTGIVRPSNSDYASPIVLAKKKDGSSRICVDYRKLNERIIKNRYPLPIIDDQLDCLRGANVFSTLDLKNDFFHVPIEDSDYKYTTFVIPGGHFEFLRLPFRLCTSPAYFQKYINIIFKDLTASGIVVIYMDDLIVHSVNEVEGLERLEKILKIASEYNLLINWKKCQFLKTKVYYLGYIVEGGTIRPSTEKTKAVEQFPEPKNIKSVQSFLGLTGFFRKFIAGYASIARPLSNLTKNDVCFQFGKDEREAFKMLKDALCRQAVLALYSPNAETELHTDASSLGLGAILLQRDDEDRQLHPIHFASWKTTKTEEKYNSYKLEVLAIVRALKKFRFYLVGIPFKVVIDCQAFTQTMSKKDISPQVARWALTLEEYRYTIEHRAGSKLQHVDALSRYPIPKILVIDEDWNTVLERLRRCQEMDSELSELISKVRRDSVEGYEMRYGLFCKQVQQEWLMVVPKQMQHEVIRKCHEQGHFGATKTEQLIRRDYWFKGMREKVQRWIANCVSCILPERKHGKPEGLLHSLDKGEGPMDTYHVDPLEPLASTKKNYNHIFAVVDAFTKFVWLYPTKTTSSAETINKLLRQSAVFGNPRRIISDRGTAFRSMEFKSYCEDEGIMHTTIVTGVPRGNGQVERLNRTLIPILTKLAAPTPGDWHKFVDKAQQYISSRRTGVSPFTLLFGTRMKLKEDPKIFEIIEEEQATLFLEKRDALGDRAKESIAGIQAENKKAYDKKRKKASCYQENDLVAIRRTQGQNFLDHTR